MNFINLGRTCGKKPFQYHLDSFQLSYRPVRGIKSLGLDESPVKKQKKLGPLVGRIPTNEDSKWDDDNVVSRPVGLELLKDKRTDFIPGGFRPGGEPWKRSWLYLPKRLNIREKKRLVEILRAQRDKTSTIPQKLGGMHLHWAVDPWKEMEVRNFLEKGVFDINQKNEDGRTPLHLVAQQNLPDAAQLLLDFGADVNIVDQRGFTPLHCAVLHKANNMIVPLLDAGANINAQNIDEETPLSIAIRRNSLSIAKILLDKGVNIVPLKGSGSSAVHLATKLRRKHLLKMLLDKGSGMEFRDRSGRTPLHHAAEKDEYRAAFMLLKRGAKIDVQDNKGNTPLHLALEKLSGKTTAVLIQMGADTSIPNPNGGILDPELVRIASSRRVHGVEELQAVALRMRMKLGVKKKKVIPEMGVGENWAEEMYDRKEEKRLKSRKLRLQRIDLAKEIDEKWKSPYIFPGSEPENRSKEDGKDESGYKPKYIKQYSTTERLYNPLRKGGPGGSGSRGKSRFQKSPHEK